MVDYGRVSKPCSSPSHFLSDKLLEVSADNVAEIAGIGRSRWKIENEQCNVQKNHGYELTHNYGHGQQKLSMVFYLLNLLAFLAHMILDRGDRLYQRC